MIVHPCSCGHMRCMIVWFEVQSCRTLASAMFQIRHQLSDFNTLWSWLVRQKWQSRDNFMEDALQQHISNVSYWYSIIVTTHCFTLCPQTQSRIQPGNQVETNGPRQLWPLDSATLANSGGSCGLLVAYGASTARQGAARSGTAPKYECHSTVSVRVVCMGCALGSKPPPQ